MTDTPTNAPVSEALKPCPFCNAPIIQPPQNSDRPNGAGWYQFIWCTNCDAQGGERPSEIKAIAAWNTRPSAAAEPPSVNEVEAVARAIAAYRYKPGYQWDKMFDGEREFVRGEARAAIASMSAQITN